MPTLRRAVRWISPLTLALLLTAPAIAQQPTAGPLSVQTTILPKGFTRQHYRFQLKAQGGIAPLKWTIDSGALPKGISLERDGSLKGIPTERGEFHVVVTVTDSSVPAQQRNQELVLTIYAPLFLEWGRYPAISGQRIEGSAKISNTTEEDFDLTFVVVAVNENGRATALGYQRLTLNKGTHEMEIPFGETLPTGTYEINVDAVGEVAATNTIHRARLVADKLTLQPQL